MECVRRGVGSTIVCCVHLPAQCGARAQEALGVAGQRGLEVFWRVLANGESMGLFGA